MLNKLDYNKKKAAIDRLCITPAPVKESAISSAADSSNHTKELDDFTDRLNKRCYQSAMGSQSKLKDKKITNSTHGSPRNHNTR